MCTSLLTRIHQSESFTVLPEDINDDSMNDRSTADTNLPAIASNKIKSIYHQNCIVPNEDFSILYNSISGKLQPQPLLSTGLLNKNLYSSSKDFFNKVSSKLRDLRPKPEVNEEEQKERKMDRPMFITTVKTGTFLEPPPEVAALLGLRKNSFGSNTASSNSSTGKTTQNVACNRNVIYSFASKPRILKSDLQSNMASRSLFRSEIRREKREIPNELPKLSNETTDGGPQYGNTMFDRRVARGSNFASQRPNVTSTEHVLSRQAEARRRAAVRQRAQIRARKLRLGTPPPIDGRKHGQIQTDKYLEELTERPPDKSIACQADLPVEHDTPIHLYDSSTQVVEAETQIYPGDLPHTDDQLPSVVTSIVKKILHEAILEINEELDAIRLRNLASEKRVSNSSQDGDNGVITKNELNDIVVQAIETVKKSEEFTSSDKNWNDIDNDRLVEKIFNEIKNTIKDVTFLADIIKKQMENWSDFEINKETSPIENESDKDAEEENASNSGNNDNMNETDLRKVSAPSINEESYSDDRESEEDNSDREDEGLAPMNAEIDNYRDKTDNFEDENEDSTNVKSADNVINEDQNTTTIDRENAEDNEGSNFGAVTRTNSAVENDRENQASPDTPEAEDRSNTPEAEDRSKGAIDDEDNINERNRDDSEDDTLNDESNSPELSNEIRNQETSEEQKQLSNEISNREISENQQELSKESSNQDESDDQQQLSNESINQDTSDDKKQSPVSNEEENVELITKDDTSKDDIKDENESMNPEESESNENAPNNITNANDNGDDQNSNENIEEEHINKRPDSSTDVMSQLDPPINDTNSSDDIIIEGNDNNKPINDTSTTEINAQNERNSNLTNERESDEGVNQENSSENENTIRPNNESLENVDHDISDTITSEEITDQSASRVDHATDKHDSTLDINEENTSEDSSHVLNENELSSSNPESNKKNSNSDPHPANQKPSDNISEQNDLSERPNTSVTVDAESTSTNEDDNDVIAVKPTLESTLDNEITNDTTSEGQPTSGVIPDEQQDSYINEMPDNSPRQTEDIKTDTIQENGTNETDENVSRNSIISEDNSTQKGNIETSTQELTKDKQSDTESVENNELQNSDENAMKTDIDAESGNLSGKPEKSSESVSLSELKPQESVEENDIHDTSTLNDENIVKTKNESNDEIIATHESQKNANAKDTIPTEEITESDKRSSDLGNQSSNQTDNTDSQEKATSEVSDSTASQPRDDNIAENDDLSIKENSDTKNDTSETDLQQIESKVQETNNNDSNIESKNPTTVVRNGSVVTSR